MSVCTVKSSIFYKHLPLLSVGSRVSDLVNLQDERSFQNPTIPAVYVAWKATDSADVEVTRSSPVLAAMASVTYSRDK